MTSGYLDGFGNREHSTPKIFCEFYLEPEVDQKKTEEAGKIVYTDREWCKMVKKGANGQTTFERVERLRLAHIWPFVEKAYEAWKDGRGMPLDGTPLKSWPQITPGQVLTLESLHIRTVEDLARCEDQALENIGMGARGLRQKARDYLDAGNNLGKVVEEISSVRAQAEAAKSENAELARQLEEMKAQIAALASLRTADDEPARRGPGRPPKDQAA
jgi:hypothetical protein